MEFLNKSNYNLLLDIIKEEVPNININMFQSMFLDFGTKEKGDLLSLNKKFIYLVMTIISTNNTQSQPPSYKPDNLNQPIDVTYQKHSQLKRVSFEHEVDKHRLHFQQFAAPPIPPTPKFSDDLTDDKINIDVLLHNTLKDRNYDIPLQKPPRQLQIGSIIPNNELNHDIIALPQPNEMTQSNIQTMPPQNPEKITSSFFSKLHNIPKTSQPESGNSQEIKLQDNSEINVFPLQEITALQEENMKLKKEIEEIKHILSLLYKPSSSDIIETSNGL
jgi:hypothetical protein